LIKFRGVKDFRINDPLRQWTAVKQHLLKFISRPKELELHEEQPAYMFENRALSPLSRRVLRNFVVEDLRYLLVHHRAPLDKLNNVSMAAWAREGKAKEEAIASLSKTQLINGLVRSGTTWNRGVATLRINRRLLAKEKRDAARDARIRLMSGRTMVDG
jgi:hypothetical protein